MPLTDKKPELLLHICCAGCGAYVAEVLGRNYVTVLYFYNPSISPAIEYERRRDEAGRIAGQAGLRMIAGRYGHIDWLAKVKGLEKEPERGRRCAMCYRDRLEMTARSAREMDFPYFASTLSVSPHKDAGMIARIGRELSKEYGPMFIAADFKKNDGFKKACQLSRELKLYRQNYCGCEFSQKNRDFDI